MHFGGGQVCFAVLKDLKHGFAGSGQVGFRFNLHKIAIAKDCNYYSMDGMLVNEIFNRLFVILSK